MGSVFAQTCVCAKIRGIGLFRKMPFSRHFAHFFGHPSLRPFFPLGALLACCRNVDEVDTRETLRKKGVSDWFRVFLPRRLLLLLLKASVLRTVFDDNFSPCHYLFSTFRSSNFWRNWALRFENALGLQSRGRFEKFFFGVVSGACSHLTRGERAGASIFCRVWCRWQKWPCRCGAEGFRVFLGVFVFWRPLFRKLSSGPLHAPLFLFRCLFAFLMGLGATPHCTCVFGQLAFDLLIFRSPWFLSLLFVTFSLFFLSCFVFFPFLVVLSLFFCFLAFVHEKNNIKILHLKVLFS